MENENIFDEKRTNGAGRRKTDENKCSMHDYLFGQNNDCLKIIKDTIKTEVAKGEHRFDVINLKLEKYITKWAFGIIGSVIAFLSMIIISISAWQFLALREDVRDLSHEMVRMNNTTVDSMLSLNIAVAEIKLNQQATKKFIEKIIPEHEKLMEHLKHQEKQ